MALCHARTYPRTWAPTSDTTTSSYSLHHAFSYRLIATSIYGYHDPNHRILASTVLLVVLYLFGQIYCTVGAAADEDYIDSMEYTGFWGFAFLLVLGNAYMNFIVASPKPWKQTICPFLVW